MVPDGAARRTRLVFWLWRGFYAFAGLFLFIIALSLLKKGAGSYGRQLIDLLDVSTPARSLGFGWLLAYIFLSGSPVAAVAVSFFASGAINGLQTFTMITGSRLGAAFVVLFIGFIYQLRGHGRELSVAVGVLALLVTAAIYLPALAIGYWLLSSGMVGVLQANASGPIGSLLDAMVNPLVGLISGLLPGWGTLGIGAGALLGAFTLIDRALPQVGPDRGALRHVDALVNRPIAIFLVGAAVTSVTLSVSVSLSLLVPLVVRGVLRRESALPYIMGANITTFIDTLVAALIVGGPAAFTIVLVEMLSVAVLSLAVLLLAYAPFARVLLALQELITRSRGGLAIFLLVLLMVPLMLLFARF